ncbi:recombinase family protein [Bacilliculturomica massiliensis]|uniref:recombinase family protein n=1 Tax=Bacilliculturomica massiliensis TaxID=1917867 RepID=UPI00102FDB18|nr:recombinase family protein [Bacilliculturomica massiliensis]
MMYGYIRVSSKDQNEDRQVIAMKDFGITEDLLFVDKQSGKDFNRPEYRRMLGTLRKEDVVVIKSIDRLGRNYDEILEQWRQITREIGADIVVLDMALLDTRNGRDLIGTLISDIVLQLLSYVAQTERENIRQRQKEGIEAAKARGVHLGRFPKETPVPFEVVALRWKRGEIPIREALRLLEISESCFYKRLKKVSLTEEDSYALLYESTP